jgi:hypothetical protein
MIGAAVSEVPRRARVYFLCECANADNGKQLAGGVTSFAFAGGTSFAFATETQPGIAWMGSAPDCVVCKRPFLSTEQQAAIRALILLDDGLRLATETIYDWILSDAR